MPEPAPIALTILAAAVVWLVVVAAADVPVDVVPAVLVLVDGTAVDAVELPILVAMGSLTSTRYASAWIQKTQGQAT
jgi:hypothetical protein